MGVIERAIELISPRWAAQRAFYRAQLEAARGYEAAKTGRRQSGWSRPSTSANAEVAAAGSRLRDGARDLVRNNPWAKKAKRAYVANMVGTGIMPTANTGNKNRDKKIDRAFEEWCRECDAAGMMDFFGLQALVAGTVFESGEALARYRDRRPDDGLTVPLQIQVLEPDYLDVSRFGRPQANADNVINQGIEFDRLGRRVAYYLWAEHPGDTMGLLTSRLLSSRRVPADQIAHVYRIDRPGQIRGASEYAAVMQKAHDLAEYDDAELVRKKIAACFAAFVKRSGSGQSPLAGKGATTDATGRRIERLSPGMIQYLQLDEDVEFGAPPAADGYREYTAAQLHAIAAGLGITYEALTGDLSQVNYSSYRAGQLDFRRAIEMDQWLMLIPMYCEPTWRRFIDRLVVTGVLDRPHYGVEWATPRWESVDPAKDARADREDIRGGLVSLRQAIARRGYNPEQVLREIAETNALLDELGLVLDTDPRKTRASAGADRATAAAAQPMGESDDDDEDGQD
jgi:lambda family phage portal protein